MARLRTWLSVFKPPFIHLSKKLLRRVRARLVFGEEMKQSASNLGPVSRQEGEDATGVAVRAMFDERELKGAMDPAGHGWLPVVVD